MDHRPRGSAASAVFLAEGIAALRVNRHFRDGVAGALLPDAARQARAEAIVLPRLDQIVADGSREDVRFRADIDGLLDPSL